MNLDTPQQFIFKILYKFESAKLQRIEYSKVNRFTLYVNRCKDSRIENPTRAGARAGAWERCCLGGLETTRAGAWKGWSLGGLAPARADACEGWSLRESELARARACEDWSL